MGTDNTKIAVTLSDRWYELTQFGLRIGSPDVGMSRVQLIGTMPQWEAARAHVANDQSKLRGSGKASATMALRRIDAMLRCYR